METKLICPRCKSKRLNKYGMRYSGSMRQSYYCRDCHRATFTPEQLDVKSETEAKLFEGEAPVSRNNINGISQC
jgi:transposase-like protein